MEIQEYNDQKRELQTFLLNFLENDDTNSFQLLCDYIKTQQIQENIDELRALLCLLSKVSKNHHRNPNFFVNIEQILSFLEPNIKQTFSNLEIFEIFKNNKRFLLSLFEMNIVTIEPFIIDFISTSKHNYDFFFFTEIKQLIDKSKSDEIESLLLKMDSEIFYNFEEKRKIGENDNYICKLIRNDSIQEFVSYTTQINLNLYSKIKPSIFETNSFLLDNDPTLIEYSAFYGSVQILNYLRMNDISLNSSLWLYTIHSNNAEIIHFLEDNHIQPNKDDSNFEDCLYESIKCHHNDIANYIQNNLIDQKAIDKSIDKKYSSNILSYSFRYYNYAFFPSVFNNKIIIHYLCQYNYPKLVKLLLKSNKIDPNVTVVLNLKIIYNDISNEKYLNGVSKFLF